VDLDAFILIGGRSTRFGADKALAEFEGETLASRAVRIVEDAFPGINTTLITASTDQFSSNAILPQRSVVSDLKPGYGAWSAVHAALSHSGEQFTLVVACDLPCVTADFLREIAEAVSDDVDAVVPRQPDGKLQPLCAIYRTSVVLDMVEAELSHAEKPPPLASISANVKTIVVAAPADILRNVNNPFDLTE